MARPRWPAPTARGNQARTSWRLRAFRENTWRKSHRSCCAVRRRSGGRLPDTGPSAAEIRLGRVRAGDLTKWSFARDVAVAAPNSADLSELSNLVPFRVGSLSVAAAQ